MNPDSEKKFNPEEESRQSLEKIIQILKQFNDDLKNIEKESDEIVTQLFQLTENTGSGLQLPDTDEVRNLQQRKKALKEEMDTLLLDVFDKIQLLMIPLQGKAKECIDELVTDWRLGISLQNKIQYRTPIKDLLFLGDLPPMGEKGRKLNKIINELESFTSVALIIP